MDANQRFALVRQFPLFSGISPADCTSIISSAREKSFLRGQTFYLAGDSIQQTWLLTSGCVKVTQLGPNGDEVILRLTAPGEFVGALCSQVCRGSSHCSGAQALQSSRTLVWDSHLFETISERFPLLRRNIGRILGERLREMEERFREVSTEKVGPRLGSQLIRLQRQIGKQADHGAVEINLSRADLAQLTGTTLFTVSRLLCQWEQRGIVLARRETVLILAPQALQSMSECQ
jgi:CRP-like cAMP-binding protein